MRQSGVVLLEVLIAFSIMAVSLTVLLQVASANVNRHKIIENKLSAASHASNLLAEIGISVPIEKSDLAGRIDDQYSWRVNIKDISSGERHRDTQATSLSLVAVELIVSWEEGAKKREYIVNTKKIVWQ